MTTDKLCLVQTLSHPTATRELDDLHRKYGFGDSRLLKVRGYLNFLQQSAPEAIWSHEKAIHEDRFCEVWNISHNSYTYNLMVTSYRATRSPASGVRNPDTPKAVNRLLAHMQSSMPSENKAAATRLFNTLFNSHSADCVYAVDIDEQEWSMVMHDNRNYTRVLLEVFKSR